MKKKIGCVIMASGLGMRFGGNKLMADFHGKTLFEHVLDLTESLFAKRVVVTRNVEVKDVCEQNGVEVVFHAFPDRNDTVRLGISCMEGMDGCLFCPCDQPFLKRESLIRLCEGFEEGATEKKILRLGFGEQQGSPVLFDKKLFEELKVLPAKKGGSYLTKKYPESVTVIFATDAWELFDVDTKEDYLLALEKIKF